MARLFFLTAFIVDFAIEFSYHSTCDKTVEVLLRFFKKGLFWTDSRNSSCSLPRLEYQGFALIEGVVDYEIVYCDYLGSPRLMTDQSGLVTWRQDYYAFGSDYGAVSSGNTHKFTGHLQDAATGQYYAKARYFTTNLGRWSQPEPLLKGVPPAGFLAYPQQLNPYVYCVNNPLRLVDPDGNQVFDKVEDLQKAGMAAVNDPALVKNEKGTWCNKAVMQIAEAGGNTDYSGDNNANAIVGMLQNTDYATTLTEQQAVDYAKAGAVVVAGVTDNPSGHVAVVAPANMQTSGKWGRSVPMIYNVGKSNKYGRASEGFSKGNQPNYHIRNIDKSKVDSRGNSTSASASGGKIGRTTTGEAYYQDRDGSFHFAN